MSVKAIDNLLLILDLEPLEKNLLRGRSPQAGWQRVYGQVLGQALVAAVRIVERGRTAHSLHAYFLLAGDPSLPIIYEVERIRDGGSFTTRGVKTIQHGRAMFPMSVSFRKAEEGFKHQERMPDVPPPETLPREQELAEKILPRLPRTIRYYWERERPIEMRPVDISRYLDRKPQSAQQQIWIRANGRLPDCDSLHKCVLAYASHFTLLDTALIAHGKRIFDSDIHLASLDHALWFHRPFRADERLLYVQHSPSASVARGFCLGSVFSHDGALVAFVTQEGLIRQRKTKYVVN
jgi:acyl-CoA thioesterase-2